MSANLLTTHFRNTLKIREERKRQEENRVRDACDSLDAMFKFRADFMKRYSLSETACGDDAESAVFRGMKTHEDFIAALDNVKMRDLEAFLNSFVAYYIAPMQAAVYKDERGTMPHPHNTEAYAKARKKLIADYKRDPARLLILNDRLFMVLGTVAAIMFFAMAADSKDKYDAARDNKDFDNLIQHFAGLIFSLAVGLGAVASVLYNGYRWNQHSLHSGPAASNENFLQWVGTADSARAGARYSLGFY